MRFFTASITSLFFAGTVFASPLLTPIQKYAGETTGRHVVQLKDNALLSTVLGALNINPAYKWDHLNGFADTFDDPTLALIRASPEVALISEDGIMTTMATQLNATWGLSRINRRVKHSVLDPTRLDFKYSYDDSAGEGVDIYIVDTGIRTTHTEFGGRARWGATFGGYEDKDGNGHGTHCAGTAAGYTYGVSKKADLIAVKVLSDEGSGSIVDIISGMEFVVLSSIASRRPSVLSMSLGGGASPPIDMAVQIATNAGVHVAVAAGNANEDAAQTSPAREPSAITVGASTIKDERAVFSNFGAIVDIFAPGQDIISAWNTDDKATNMISGTSMATPHVAGLIAYLIGAEGNKKPADMSNRLKELATVNALTGLDRATCNLLAYNGFKL